MSAAWDVGSPEVGQNAAGFVLQPNPRLEDRLDCGLDKLI